MISVIVATRDRASLLEEHTRSAVRSGSPGCPVEILVVDNGSIDRDARSGAGSGQASSDPGHLPHRVEARKVPRAEYRRRARARRPARIHRRRCAALAADGWRRTSRPSRDRRRLRGRPNPAALGGAASPVAHARAARGAGGSRRRHATTDPRRASTIRSCRSARTWRFDVTCSTASAAGIRSRQTEEHAAHRRGSRVRAASSPPPDSPASTSLKRACSTAFPRIGSVSSISSAGATATARIEAGLEQEYPSTTNYLFRVPRYLWRRLAKTMVDGTPGSSPLNVATATRERCASRGSAAIWPGDGRARHCMAVNMRRPGDRTELAVVNISVAHRDTQSRSTCSEPTLEHLRPVVPARRRGHRRRQRQHRHDLRCHRAERNGSRCRFAAASTRSPGKAPALNAACAQRAGRHPRAYRRRRARGRGLDRQHSAHFQDPSIGARRRTGRSALAAAGPCLAGGRTRTGRYSPMSSPLALLHYGEAQDLGSRTGRRRKHGRPPNHVRGAWRIRPPSGQDTGARCWAAKTTTSASVRSQAGYRCEYRPELRVRHWVPAERTRLRYFLRWFFWSGITHAVIESEQNSTGDRSCQGRHPASLSAAAFSLVLHAAPVRRSGRGRPAAAPGHGCRVRARLLDDACRRTEPSPQRMRRIQRDERTLSSSGSPVGAR